QPAQRAGGGAPAGGAAGSGLRSLALASLAEDARQLVGRGHLELLVGALAHRLVRAPADELRGVAEAGALHVIVGDLERALEAERHPVELLVAVPPAGGAGHPLAGEGGPRVILAGAGAQRLEL